MKIYVLSWVRDSDLLKLEFLSPHQTEEGAKRAGEKWLAKRTRQGVVWGEAVRYGERYLIGWASCPQLLIESTELGE